MSKIIFDNYLFFMKIISKLKNTEIFSAKQLKLYNYIIRKGGAVFDTTDLYIDSKIFISFEIHEVSLHIM